MNIDEQLRLIFRKDDPYEQAAYQDLFALGCFLHATGQAKAGLKTCATALRGAHCNNEVVGDILAFVPGNEQACFEAAWPHAELKALLSLMSP